MQRRPMKWMAVVGLMALFLLAGCQSNATNGTTKSTATDGPIRVSVDRSAYGVSDPVGVTVSNTSKTVYYSLDGKSACTILQLQKYDSSKNVWATTYACTVALPIQALQVPAGIAEPFSLTPSSPSDENTWQKGTYRIAVVYSDNADGKTGAQTAYSVAFDIR